MRHVFWACVGIAGLMALGAVSGAATSGALGIVLHAGEPT